MSLEHTLTRREALKLAAAGGLGISMSGWMEPLAAQVAQQAQTGVRIKQCILLWMDGGPSHHDTFDMKPDAVDNIRGMYRPIASSVPGIQITEKLPRIAPLMHHAAVLRGMATGEADHGRAAHLHAHRLSSRPGRLALSQHGLARLGGTRPVGNRHAQLRRHRHAPQPRQLRVCQRPGYLGPRHQPLIVADQNRGVENLAPLANDFDDRLGVLDQMAQGFQRTNPAAAAAGHRTVYQRAVQLMRSERARAFDLSREPEQVRSMYGQCAFGQGCLLARRLIEVGVPFVEVYHAPTPGGWDIHSPERVNEVKNLAFPQLDRGMSALLSDLEARGMLDNTLVIWMGEFGRTPRVNNNGGRDHYGRAWTSVLFGGGVRGGQVIGRTDPTGATVVDRPISALDFMASICMLLGVDPNHQHMAGERPVRVVDRGFTPIRELVG